MTAGRPPDRLHLGLLMHVAARALETRVMGALADAGFDDLTPAQGRLFAQVAAEGTRLTELAERTRVTKQTAGFLVDALERAGYVRRVPDPTDARARLVVIAERGEAAVRAARVAEAEVEAEWTRHLGERRSRSLRRTLERLREVVDPYR